MQRRARLAIVSTACGALLMGLAGCSGGGANAPTAPTTPTRVISLSGTLAFGAVTVGQTLDRTLTITNTGNSTLAVTGMTGPTGFATTWSSGTIAAGTSQAVTIRFSPTLAQAYSGTITVNGDHTAGTNTAAVSGTGIAPAGTRIIALSGSMAFGAVTVGQTSDRALTITNTGNSSLTVTCVTGPTGFSSNWTSGIIGAGLLQVATIRFAPTALQAYTGVITVCADQTSGANTLAVSGTGSAQPSQPPVINQFSLSPNSIVPGGSATLQWNVSGASTVSINQGIGTVSSVGQMSVRPSLSTDYQIVATNGDGNALRSAFLYVGPSDTCSAAFYPAGTTAVCNNGQYSQSQNRSGTCSSNGGVRCWICPGRLCTG